MSELIRTSARIRSRVAEPHITSPQSGQALIELALILPILLGLTLGVIEIGRFAYIGILIGNAARAGAAYGAQSNEQSSDSAGIINAANYDFAGATTGSTTKANGQLVTKLTVTNSTYCGCDNAGTLGPALVCSSKLNPTAGTCVTGRWVVVVSVTATGSFNSLFTYPGIPNPLVITRTASIPVA
jgi:Flp pilus assembly protein TadG